MNSVATFSYDFIKKISIFYWSHITLRFSCLTPFHLLKVSKFLVKISRFRFLVITEKNIFVYKLFLSLIF